MSWVAKQCKFYNLSINYLHTVKCFDSYLELYSAETKSILYLKKYYGGGYIF